MRGTPGGTQRVSPVPPPYGDKAPDVPPTPGLFLSWPLLRLDPGVRHDLPELGDLRADLHVEGFGAARRRIRAKLLQSLLDVGQLQRTRDLSAQLCEHRSRRLRGRNHSEPRIERVAG